MEEQNKKTVGMMYPDSPGKQFWHIWGPDVYKRQATGGCRCNLS